ncbi:uncharacterized protein LOC106644980 [Copidosoma floridanum]|uniref:uncharacterized protein LOC106644980 n=1 Tax=Copidosoma floridanum TaxID=29053 RepID=UPI0006C9B947|nr:uncharacterized protein LOC106644980 [Copidosoma floridanum]
MIYLSDIIHESESDNEGLSNIITDMCRPGPSRKQQKENMKEQTLELELEPEGCEKLDALDEKTKAIVMSLFSKMKAKLKKAEETDAQHRTVTKTIRSLSPGKINPKGIFRDTETNTGLVNRGAGLLLGERVIEQSANRDRIWGGTDHTRPQFTDYTQATNSYNHPRRPQNAQHNMLPSLSHMASNIPFFDGDPINLPLFYKDGEDDHANDWLNLQTGTVQEFLHELSRRYGSIKNADTLMAQLKIIRQQSRKSIEDYSGRGQRLYNRLTMLHDSNPSLFPIQKQVLKESSEDKAVKQFTYSLHPTYRCKITCLNPRTFCEAIIEALKMESDFSLRHAIPVSALPTYNTTTEMGPLVNLASKEEKRMEITKGAQGATASEKRCIYCKGQTGHSVKECRRLMALINDRKTSRDNGREPKENSNYCQRSGHNVIDCHSQHMNINRNAYYHGNGNDNLHNNNYNNYNRGYNNGPSEPYYRNDNNYNRNNNYNTGNNGSNNDNTGNNENGNYNNRNINYYDRNNYNNRYNNYNPRGSNYYSNRGYGDPYNNNNGEAFNRYRNNIEGTHRSKEAANTALTIRETHPYL